jgi:ATP-dependent HslUV protease ATP-binding subunit HslU
LHTVMERLLEDVSFEADSLTGSIIDIDAAFVDKKLSDIVSDENLSQFIL